MILNAVPQAARRSQIVSVNHKMIALDPAIKGNLILYLYIQLGLCRLENGPFTVLFLRDDGTMAHTTFAFRGHTANGQRLAIAVDDETLADDADLPGVLQELQRRLPAEVADVVWLLTERGLDCASETSVAH